MRSRGPTGERIGGNATSLVRLWGPASAAPPGGTQALSRWSVLRTETAGCPARQGRDRMQDTPRCRVLYLLYLRSYENFGFSACDSPCSLLLGSSFRFPSHPFTPSLPAPSRFSNRSGLIDDWGTCALRAGVVPCGTALKPRLIYQRSSFRLEKRLVSMETARLKPSSGKAQRAREAAGVGRAGEREENHRQQPRARRGPWVRATSASLRSRAVPAPRS